MGMIEVTFLGSFDKSYRKVFKAEAGGHADAVAQAIEFLSAEALPAAIRQDHRLHTEGAKPRVGFGRREEPTAI